ncbi:hypothetical protein FV219_03250 [Methylobacterium sp. WL122]|nr:hypothetical protein FV219_03250 [Methylobacterium sp. WL122]
MGKKSEPAESPRKGVNTRITDELRAKIEKSAAHTNRTVGSDIEHRLEASFKLDFVNSDGLGALLHNEAALQFVSNAGAVIDQTISVARERKFSEIETRKALRSALAVVISRHMWVGEEFPDAVGRPRDGMVKPKDLPPVRLGMHLAAEHMLWDSAWNDRAAVDDALDGRVANRWTGDGSMIELGEPPKPKPMRRDLKDISLEEVEADPRFDDPKNLDLYKRIG